MTRAPPWPPTPSRLHIVITSDHRNESLAGLLLAINSFPLAEPHVIFTEWRQYHAC